MREQVTLTEAERRALDEIARAAAQSDPALAARLAGRGRNAALALRRVQGWPSLVLLVLGAALVLGTFTWSLPLAAAGLAVMMAGAFGLAAVVEAWLERRRERRRTTARTNRLGLG